MAKILVLSYLPLYPANHGGRVRIREIASRLAQHHEVSVLCPPETPPRERPAFALYARGVRGWRQMVAPQTFATAIAVAREAKPDVVLLEYLWQGAHAIALRLLRGVPVIFDAFDVVTLRMRREGRRIWPLVSLYERAILRAADRVLAVSDFDRTELVKLGATSRGIDIVPNGVDTCVFRPNDAARAEIRNHLRIDTDERLLFFFGQLGYTPNVHAVAGLAEELMPRLGRRYRLAVAGPGGAGLRRRYEREGITFLGEVDDVPAHIGAADAVVAPIQSGSGTRLKILESLACGAPTVTTRLGAEGLDLSACGDGLRIADGWEAFAAETARAADAGANVPPVSFIEAYDWDAIVGRMRLL